MVEGKELAGVAKWSAMAAAGMLGLAAVLAVISLILPWWTGSSAIGQLASGQAVEVSITLWKMDVSIGTQKSDGAGGTTTSISKEDMAWDTLCELLAQTPDGEPPECAMIRATRAFAILTAIMALPGVLALWQALTVSPLLLVAGAFLGFLAGACAVIGVICAVVAGTDGLSGPGIIFLLAAAMLSFIATSGALYGANVAMPVDPPPAAKRFTWNQRAKEQRQKEQAGRSKDRRPRGDGLGLGHYQAQVVGGSDAGDSASSKRMPVKLKKVLDLCQEYEGDADAEEIPQALLEMAFVEISGDRDASLSIEDFMESLNLCGLNASPEAMANIMKETDVSGAIDIQEFIGFFREIEELNRYQAKSQQKTQFVQFLCNFCFIAHIIIVSVLLMEFINMNEADDPDKYLIFRQMLIAFCVVFVLLLIFVICLPALQLTLGANLQAWQRQYNREVGGRTRKKPRGDEEGGEWNGPRQAAWGTPAGTAAGLTEATVNATTAGTSYRLTKQSRWVQEAQAEVNAQWEITGMPNNFGGTANSSNYGQQRLGNTMQSSGSRRAGVITAQRGTFERYDPDAYRRAAELSMQGGVTASFSPMQVHDMSLPPPEAPEGPGFLALEAGPVSPPGMLTGTGYYHREL